MKNPSTTLDQLPPGGEMGTPLAATKRDSRRVVEAMEPAAVSRDGG